MEYPQIDIRELCNALGIAYDSAKSTSFYLMLVKEYRFRYETAQYRLHLTAVGVPEYSTGRPDPMFIPRESRTDGGR